MKKHILDFFKRGLIACGSGPIVMAIVYWFLGRSGVIETLTVNEVVMSILTVTLMAFIAAGITVVYEIERLPLMSAILIHAFALYVDYILIYLLNGWLKAQLDAILIFTVVFFAGFAIIWLIIYLISVRDTQNINAELEKRK